MRNLVVMRIPPVRILLPAVALFLVVVLSKCVLVVAADDRMRGENGTLSLLVAVPLTKDNQTVLDPGWFHVAAALLAIDHFNSRNCSIVPELCSQDDCSVTFGNDVVAVDTGTNSHQAMEYLIEQLMDHGQPVDAIAGPYNDIPALELSVLATGMKAPMVAHRALNGNLLDISRHPYFSQISADPFSEMQFVASYLHHVGRNNHIAVLYSSTASELQKVDLLRTILAREGFDQVRTFSYKARRGTDTMGMGMNDMTTTPDRSVEEALEKIKETGFRTIYVLPERLDNDVPEIGRQATRLGLNDGDHFWILGGGADHLSSIEMNQFVNRMANDFNNTILRGAAYLRPADNKAPLEFPMDDLSQQSSQFFQRVQQFAPSHIHLETEISNADNPILRIAEVSNSWMIGTSYMYDAVMTIGLGACLAVRGQNGTAMTGEQHLAGIRATEFEGASGHIKFGTNPYSPGSRDSDTVFFGVINLLPNGSEQPHFVRTETLNPATGEWTSRNDPFVYADGTTSPPALLRDPPEMNFLHPAVRAMGLTLMSVGLVLVLLCTLWIYWHRHHIVVIAAQPALLYSLCLGSIMIALAILMYSYDESYVDDEEKLSRFCVANVWLDTLGHICAYGAIFTKLWRVNRCMRYKTNNIEIWRVMWPCMLLILATIGLLVAMTSSGNLRWERTIIDETTGESIGTCNADNALGYLIPIYTLHFLPTVIAGIMAWKTVGIDDLYSESKWVLAFILVQVQVLVVAAPIVALLQDESSDARFVAYSLLMFTFPLSSMGLIILPKIMTVRRMERNAKPPDSFTNRPSESAPVPADVVIGDVNPMSSNDSVPTNLIGDNEGRGQRASGPTIQMVLFD